MKIYVISDSKGLYKIGVSSNIEKRKQGLQTGNGNILEIKYQSENISNAYKLESEIHKIYEQNNSSNEWFEFSKSELDKTLIEIDNLVKAKGIEEKINKPTGNNARNSDGFERMMDKFYENRKENQLNQLNKQQMNIAKDMILQAKEFKKYISDEFLESRKEEFRRCMFSLMDFKDLLKGTAKEMFSEIIENEIVEIMILVGTC
ncbi:GIY-YIG nuclease family protein [Clostridium saccharoperbutylacetonicum]|uniref:GIY-YIG nuclease family protein n=1 Tax=Clostridium saccharoperbutylacetonicum TaxID=36745 RepID=UPI0039EA978A